MATTHWINFKLTELRVNMQHYQLWDIGCFLFVMAVIFFSFHRCPCSRTLQMECDFLIFLWAQPFSRTPLGLGMSKGCSTRYLNLKNIAIPQSEESLPLEIFHLNVPDSGLWFKGLSPTVVMQDIFLTPFWGSRQGGRFTQPVLLTPLQEGAV